MLNFNSILVGTQKVKEMAAFYEAVFEKKPDMAEGGYSGWQAGSCFFTIGEHSDATGDAKEPFRIILNFETKEVKKEFKRIKEIPGVKVVKEPYSMSEEGSEDNGLIATFADPDGNYFQLMTPWEG